MVGSSNYFSHSDDEENPFINRRNNDRILKNKTNNINNNYINNNKNKRYVQNDITSDIENSPIITSQNINDVNTYYNPNRKRLKTNGQYETTIYEKEVHQPSKNNNKETISLEDISNNSNSTTETETDSYSNTPSKKPTIRNKNRNNNVSNDNNINNTSHTIINDNEAVDHTSYIINEKEKRNETKKKEKEKKEKNKAIEVEEEIEKTGENNKEKSINNSEDHSNEDEVHVIQKTQQTPSIRSKKLEKALEKTIAKINRLVSYKHFRQCFPSLSSNDREDMKDVHAQMTLYFTKAITDEFRIIFQKFEMEKNLLLIDECCRQGKKVTQDDSPNQPVNVIYNRVGPDTIIRSNSVNIKKKTIRRS